MPVDPGILGPATLAISQGFTAFSQFMPKLSDVRRADPKADTGTAEDVRIGEIAAVSVTIGMGIIMSSLTGSPVPAFVAVIVSIGLVMLYESTLRRNPNAAAPVSPLSND